MGYLLPRIGINYHYKGLVKLYNMMHDNGYEFIYLTARSMNELPQTRNYIDSITDEKDKNMYLPPGPVLMYPNSRLETLKNDIFYKTSDIFKTKILRLSQNIFQNGRGGLISGYGNQKSDMVAYVSAGMSKRLIMFVSKAKLYQLSGDFNFTFYSLQKHVNNLYPKYKEEQVILNMASFLGLKKGGKGLGGLLSGSSKGNKLLSGNIEGEKSNEDLHAQTENKLVQGENA